MSRRSTRSGPRTATGSLADLLPSVLAVLGVPGAADPLGLAAGARRRRPGRGLLVDGLGWHQLPVAAPFAPTLADLAGRPRGPAADRRLPVDDADEPGHARHRAPPRARTGCSASPCNVPGTDRVLNHIHWHDDPDPRAVAAGADRCSSRARPPGWRSRVVSRPEFAGSGLTVAAYRGGGYRRRADADDAGRADARRARRGAGAGAGRTATTPDLDRAATASASTRRSGAAAVAERRTGCSTGWSTGCRPDAALLVTADHGQLNVPGRRAGSTSTPTRGCAAGRRGGRRRAAGPLPAHRCPARVDDVVAAWRAVLGDAAWVVTARGGDRRRAGSGRCPSAHLQRIGDVVVVCHGRLRGAGHRRCEPPPVGRAGRVPRLATPRPRWRSRCWSAERGTVGGSASLLGVGRSQAVPRGGDAAVRAGRRRRRLHRSCTSTWTRSSPRSRCAGGPSCAASRSWSAAPGPRGRGAARPATRRGSTACAARCRPRAPGRCARRRCSCRPTSPAYSARVPGGHGDLPRRHPAGRAAVAGRGVPRRGRRPAAARPARRDRRADPRAGRRRAAADLLGRGGADQVRGQARLHPGQAGRPARRARPTRCSSSCTRCRSTRCGAWGSGPPRRCAGSACAPSATWPRRRSACCAARSARRPPPTCTSWPGAATRAGSSPEHVEKSIGAETTFDTDVADPAVIRRSAARPRRQGRRAGCAAPARSAARSRSRCGWPTSARSTGPARCRRPPMWPGRSSRPPGRCSRRCAAGDRIRLVGVRVEGLAAAGDAPRQLTPGRAGARLARGGGGRRRRGGPVRRGLSSVRPAFSGLPEAICGSRTDKSTRSSTVRPAFRPAHTPLVDSIGKAVRFGCPS